MIEINQLQLKLNISTKRDNTTRQVRDHANKTLQSNFRSTLQWHRWGGGSSSVTYNKESKKRFPSICLWNIVTQTTCTVINEGSNRLYTIDCTYQCHKWRFKNSLSKGSLFRSFYIKLFFFVYSLYKDTYGQFTDNS